MFFTVPFLILLLVLYFMTIVQSYRRGIFGMVIMQILIGLYFLLGLFIAVTTGGNYEPEQVIVGLIGSQIFAFITNLLLFPFAVFSIWKGRKFRVALKNNVNTEC
ncbi:hypothetical protein V144x_20700 [Gimesia aquarii]|uniref:Uncharacterized protein n=1 Tax=Gimesia aquarii TaxID=2527964 RepID=A0A517VUC7_9PLAN|nr:hypothetical protein V144x_20700 [Gimesia aquarii]